MYLPKELGFKARRAIIIPGGRTYILIPIPDEITPIETKYMAEEPKGMGEEKAGEETKGANRVEGRILGTSECRQICVGIIPGMSL